MLNESNPNRDYWNKDDLRAYILLFCANAVLIIKEAELSFIESALSTAKYDDIKAEFKADNDFVSIQKIQDSLTHLGYTEDQLDTLLAEIKQLFWSDGQFDTTERAVFRQLKSIIAT